MSFWKTEPRYQHYTFPPFTDDDVKKVEENLNIKLPESYLAFLKEQNGGVPKKCHYYIPKLKDYITISRFFGLQELAEHILTDEWGYPDIGAAIAICPSGGHELVFLDYTKRKNKEPCVSFVNQEKNYCITVLADTFEEFLNKLTDSV